MPPQRKRNVVPDTIREKIVDFVMHKGHTKGEVAKRFDYPYTTVDSIIKKYEQTGETAAQRKKGGAFRGSKVGQQHLDLMLEYVTSHPGATIVEIREHVRQETDLNLSVTTIQNCLRERLHLTLKRIEVDHSRRNSNETINARKAWLLDEAVFLDEAGFHLQQTRSVGRAPVGNRATEPGRPADRGSNLSLLVAVDRHGIQCSRVKTGAYNAATFLEFLRGQVFPALEGQHRTLLLDNVRFHRSTSVVEAVHAAGHQLLFLPPYTPEFNIAEKVFGKIKPYVGRQELREADDIRAVIGYQLSSITPEMCIGWIHECNHWMMVAEHGHRLGPEHDASAALARLNLNPEPNAIDPDLG